MNNKIKLLILKALILIGSVALFSEVFRLVKTARVNLENKNTCLEEIYEKYLEKEYTKDYSRARAFMDCNATGTIDPQW